MERPLERYINSIIEQEGYESVAVFAPGSQDISGIENVKSVYDYDPMLSYICKDVIFDDIEVEEELIVTIHGEKFYPPTRKFKEKDHILIVWKYSNNGNCTTPEELKLEAETFEVEDLEKYWIGYGRLEES